MPNWGPEDRRTEIPIGRPRWPVLRTQAADSPEAGPRGICGRKSVGAPAGAACEAPTHVDRYRVGSDCRLSHGEKIRPDVVEKEVKAGQGQDARVMNSVCKFESF